MDVFTSFAAPITEFLSFVVGFDELHAKWLNTLSYLENCGARKIAACEHPRFVKEEMLKHAAEEFRHAHYLKRQLARLSCNFEHYTSEYMLGGASALHYLHKLDLKACRYLKAKGLSKSQIREAAYLLVTYAIELRAEELYTIYDKVLRQMGSKVVVASILLEEKGHLSEMVTGIQQLPHGWEYAHAICQFETHLFQNLAAALSKISTSTSCTQNDSKLCVQL